MFGNVQVLGEMSAEIANGELSRISTARVSMSIFRTGWFFEINPRVY